MIRAGGTFFPKARCIVLNFRSHLSPASLPKLSRSAAAVGIGALRDPNVQSLLRCKSATAKRYFTGSSSSVPSQFVRRIRDPMRFKNVALIDEVEQRIISYGDLNLASSRLATIIGDHMRNARLVADSNRTRSNPTTSSIVVGCFDHTGASFVTGMIAAWSIGAVFVPLSKKHSGSEIAHIVSDCGVNVIVCNNEQLIEASVREAILSAAAGESIPFINANEALLSESAMDGIVAPIIGEHGEDALVIYTSGTTGKPKGALHTHRGVQSMVQSLVTAWEYTERDKLLHFLPLYHMHGLVNKLLCLLWVGGTIEFCASAHPAQLFQRLSEEEKLYMATSINFTADAAQSGRKGGIVNDGEKFVSMFMAVPTIYARMIEASRNAVPSTTHAMKGGISSSSSSSSSGGRGVPRPLTVDDIDGAVSAMKRMRFMACGSAALPDPIMDGWKELSSHTLLERYGMTEIGMALSNPLHCKEYSNSPASSSLDRTLDRAKPDASNEDGRDTRSCDVADTADIADTSDEWVVGVDKRVKERGRVKGRVGLPMPGVQCRIVDIDDPDHDPDPNPSTATGEQRPEGMKGRVVSMPGVPGELRIKGLNVFKGYLNLPDVTRDTFDEEGWFKTGDIAEYDEFGYFKILGRSSTDIIKSSGYKISALEIERELLGHPKILEAAVLGVPDDIVGEQIVAVLTIRPPSQIRGENEKNTQRGAEWEPGVDNKDRKAVRKEEHGLDLTAVREYLTDKLAVYKQPRELVIVSEIPRNHLGKVNKKALLRDLDMLRAQAGT